MEKIGAASEDTSLPRKRPRRGGAPRPPLPDRGGLIGGVTKVSDGQASI